MYYTNENNKHDKITVFELSVARGSPQCARAVSKIDNINSDNA